MLAPEPMPRATPQPENGLVGSSKGWGIGGRGISGRAMARAGFRRGAAARRHQSARPRSSKRHQPGASRSKWRRDEGCGTFASPLSPIATPNVATACAAAGWRSACGGIRSRAQASHWIPAATVARCGGQTAIDRSHPLRQRDGPKPIPSPWNCFLLSWGLSPGRSAAVALHRPGARPLDPTRDNVSVRFQFRRSAGVPTHACIEIRTAGAEHKGHIAARILARNR